jgi:hypothetical protein
LVLISTSWAQDSLYIRLNSVKSESFSINDIESIKFSNRNVQLKQKNGTISNKSIDSISRIDFNSNLVTDVFKSTKSNLVFIISPNPSNKEVTININSPLSSNIELTIVDISGRLIYHNEYQNTETITWDRTNNSGKNLESGIYFVSIKTEDKFSTTKLLLE